MIPLPLASRVCELRFALFSESGHALLLVRSGEGGEEEAALEAEALSEAQLVGSVDRLLAHGRGRAAERGDLGAERHGLVDDVLGRVDGRDQAGSEGLCGGELVAGEAHAHGLGLAHRAHEALRAAGARDRAQQDFGLAKSRLLAADDDVAHHGQLTAAAQREAVHRRDRRRPQPRHVLPRGEEVFRVCLREGLGRHLLDVGARREGPLAPREDDGAHLRVRVPGFGGSIELGHQRARQRVQRFGPVQRQQPHVPAPLDAHMLVRRQRPVAPARGAAGD
mmetsp:Transcript_27119/g.81335  ORF Transcript_27119/g.81335 Transcript_27119/m.81335 type:complete len:279 (+) Transcript_27119:42-878(+)